MALEPYEGSDTAHGTPAGALGADRGFMARALDLAARGPANNVNPQVGCVIVDAAGEVIAEGFHRGAGTPHAEAAALFAAAARGVNVAGATAYVTLEPCNHTGRTGPCAAALREAGVSRVMFALPDPTPTAQGGGEALRAAGITVEEGVLAREAAALIAPWVVNQTQLRPWVTVKLAMSLDGRIAAADGSSQWITGAGVRSDNHARRAAHDAIAVGTGTVFADDPSLTARGVAGDLLEPQPVPLIIGRREIPATARIHAHPQPIMQISGRDLPRELHEVYAQGIKSIYVEGGTHIATAFAAAGLVDEFVLYVAPSLLGGSFTWLHDLGVTTLATGHAYEFHEVQQMGRDVLLRVRPLPTTQPATKLDEESTTCLPA